jgi:hypothetical protein
VGQLGAQAVLVGAGHCTVFVAGREVIGTWRRASRDVPATYYDSEGRVIRLTPGQTFVELLYYTYPLTVTPAPASSAP